tara:strand:- start:33 stop:266 length:234 start_codon:yes stop_codon:yes gene_type:complete
MRGINSGGRAHNPGHKVQCLQCGDVIQSMFRHDFKWCACKSIAVDGGGDYLKMSYTEGSEYKVLEKEDNAENTENES